jgi:two-component system, sporulation sensor kinase E
MAPSRTSGLDKILGRLDDLDSVNLNILVQRLVRERRLQESVFNTIRDGILVVDSDGTVQYANAVGRQMIGLEEKEVGMARLWKMVPDLARSIDLEELEPDADGKPPVISRELEMTYPERRIVRLYMMPIELPPAGSGVLQEGYVVVLTDVTEAKVSMEERLEQERTSSIVRLAAGVAHELGNPLNSLTIHLQLLSRQLKKNTAGLPAVNKLLDSVAICQGEVERLDGIITHFLEAIRPTQPNCTEVDLLQLLDEVMAVQGPELAARSIEISIEIKTPPAAVLADRNQVKQVYFNVIKNAMEAMAGGGRLRVRSRSDDAYLYIQFADTGEGIADEDLSKVFQAYFTTKKSGHGLGMMIVQRIMRDHGGHVSIESRQGVGTVVTLQFPLPHRRTRLLQEPA